MPKIENLNGMRFGRWTVVSQATNKKDQRAWNCVCDCGRIGVVRTSPLNGGKSTQCCACAATQSGKKTRKHGHCLMGKMSPTMMSHYSMKQRCLNKNAHEYENYGGRGIGICKEWLGESGFSIFLSDMGERPDGTSIERVDNNKGYSKDNCIWATREQQQSNKRTSVIIEHQGIRKTLSQWADFFGIKVCTIWRRYHRNNLRGDALFRPVRTLA